MEQRHRSLSASGSFGRPRRPIRQESTPPTMKSKEFRYPYTAEDDADLAKRSPGAGAISPIAAAIPATRFESRWVDECHLVWLHDVAEEWPVPG